MARLADVPIVLRRVGVFKFIWRVWYEVNDDQLWSWGGALAYSWLFALFPFLIFMLTLLPYLPERVIVEAYTQVQIWLYDSLPESSAYTIWTNIERMFWQPPAGLFSLGLLATVFAASGGVNMTMTALDRCYEIGQGRSVWHRRLIAIAITLVVTTLIVVVLALIPVGNWLTKFTIKYWTDHQWYLPGWIVWTWNIARYLLAGFLMFTIVAIMYHFGISAKQRWRIFSPGAIFTIGVWILLSFAFRWYVNSFGKESYNRTYGTVGGVAVLLLFFYLDALVLMVGAEINAEIDYEMLGVERGSRDFTVPPQEVLVEPGEVPAAQKPLEPQTPAPNG